MTLREHLEANEQLLGFALNAADVAAPKTLEEAIKQARKHAVAALAILDAAPYDVQHRVVIYTHAVAALAILDAAPYDVQHRVVIYTQSRLVPDPKPSA